MSLMMTVRQLRRDRRKLQAALLGALVGAYAVDAWWHRHPAEAIVAGVGAVILAIGVGVALRWYRWREDEKTCLYRHYGADSSPVYFGIANDYDRRCREHWDDWWWPYVDPAQSTVQWFPNRDRAAAAETAAIRKWRPMANIRDNPNATRRISA